MTVFQRSSDVYTGLPYDVPWHCELIKKMTSEIRNRVNKKNTDKKLFELECGTLIIFISSLHLYKKDFEKALSISKNKKLSAA